MQQGSLYVGLMSGTSMDGVDAALVRFGDNSCEVVATHSQPYPSALRETLSELIANPGAVTIDRLGNVDNWIGECFAETAAHLLEVAAVEASAISAIGSHGQTVRHQPRAERPFTVQLGDPNIIAARTGVTTVADFRRRDLALGGEGAPLAPTFHQWLLQGENAVVVNLGGIANITVIGNDRLNPIGFDTGPANTLMDAWCRLKKSRPFDDNGAWARSGRILETLFEILMNDPYLRLAPPKSTGLEYFNMTWLDQKIGAAAQSQPFRDEDVQATLAEFSAASIVNAIHEFTESVSRILICGGGYRNDFLVTRIADLAAPVPVVSTADIGVPPDWVEAAAFAWLARQTLSNLPGNLPSVTGARHGSVLGGIFLRNA